MYGKYFLFIITVANEAIASKIKRIKCLIGKFSNSKANAAIVNIHAYGFAIGKSASSIISYTINAKNKETATMLNCPFNAIKINGYFNKGRKCFNFHIL